MDRQTLQADLVCVGFGPAAAGFLTTLSPVLAETNADGTPKYESKVMPGMPLQVLCYERADDIGFGVSGIVTQARAIQASYPGQDLTQLIPNSARAHAEEVAYLLDPGKASRRTFGTKFLDATFKAMRQVVGKAPCSAKLPWIPGFLSKHDGLVMSMGSFLSWVGGNLMGSGTVQIWPGTPVSAPLFDGDRVKGVRLADQGVDKHGNPTGAYMPGMDIEAALTIVADGPVGPVGQALTRKFGLPPGHHIHDWAVGMKAVVKLPDSCKLEPGTVLHTLGYPEPEIFGFLYVYPDRTASLGIFVPSWLDSPARTSYRYLQHWMRHPYLWQHLEGATLTSWGAKSLQESGVTGEPMLCGDGFARIGEGSGTTNVLTNSGVDEAWRSGVLLAQAVIQLLQNKQDYTRENLEQAYVKLRRADYLNQELQAAKKARNGFGKGLFWGLLGTGMTGITGGLLNVPFKTKAPHTRVKSHRAYYNDLITEVRLDEIAAESLQKQQAQSNRIMDALGWEPIPYDGVLLMSHQDALLKGGKVQAPDGYADHVTQHAPKLCQACTERTCVEICSGQALTPAEDGSIAFDHEKCVHCGACLWGCSRANPANPDESNINFAAGAGGLRSNEN